MKLFDPLKTGPACVPIMCAQVFSWVPLFNGVSRLVAPGWGFKEYTLETRDGGEAVYIPTGGLTFFSRAQALRRTAIGAVLSAVAVVLFAKFA